MAEKKAQADIKADVEQQFFCHLAHMHTAKFLTFLTCHGDVGARGGLICEMHSRLRCEPSFT